MSNKILIYCTIGSEPEGQRLANTLVEEQLVACVTLVPAVRSIYRWQGAVEDSQETLLILKTTTQRWHALRDRVLELHPYQVPELVALPIADGNPSYLEWIDSSTAEL